MATAMTTTVLLLTSVCLLAGRHCALGQQVQEQCQSIVTAASSNQNCSPLGNCTGITCSFDDGSSSATFSVNKCTQPLQIDVWVSGTGINFSNTFTSDGEVTEGGTTVALMTLRNDLTDTVNVQVTVENMIVFPDVSVPLNQSVCMCQSLMAAANLTVENTISTDCFTNSACDGIECTFRIFTDYFIEVDWQRCDEPTGVLMALRIHSGMLLSENYFNESVNTTVSPYDIPIYITMVNTPYFTSFKVVIEAIGQTLTLMDANDVIVDKSGCSVPGVLPPGLIPPQPVSNETCSALKNVAGGFHEAFFTMCDVTSLCTGLECSTIDIYVTNMQILSCTQEIAVEIRRLGVVLLTEIVSQTKVVPLEFGDAYIIIRNVSAITMGVEVDLFTGFNPGSPINLLPYVEIRRSDYCLCQANDCLIVNSPTVMPTSPAPNNAARAIVVIAVPIIFILVIVVIVLSIAVGYLACKKRRKRTDEPSVPFHKMTADEEDGQSDAAIVGSKDNHSEEEGEKGEEET